VSILPLATNIFPAAAAEDSQTHTAAIGISHITATRSDEDLDGLFDEFQQKHGQMNSDTMFINFKRYVALVDNHPTNSVVPATQQFFQL